ncbi:hypothetical protein DL240_01270 [Lujinxingia litoralis]|uniref:Uncharacterized protein n=1 Tax=Lujinxingia litoralis TaxID=2211119 RepID=A0A328CA93_9DELT|nr:hypothetical protein [Lujinxingia litoralis]RAL24868.1 hypothetical protein DL240_01270 [Lujinxingia litoralis]
MSEETPEQAIDTTEGTRASLWEERFEAQINTFFDEAIARVPGFVDRNLKSFRRVMGRSLGPRTGMADLFISARNMAAGMSRSVGGPDFSTSTFTDDQLTEAFEREVVSSVELESLLGRLFSEFEEEQWQRFRRGYGDGEAGSEDIEGLRRRLGELMEHEIAHDPLLAQAIRSGVRLGLPATLGYILFGRTTFVMDGVTEGYSGHLDIYRRALGKLGGLELPGWIGAVGLAGGLMGTLALGGLVEYAVNNVRDIKGYYIRQINAARYVLLYGEDPEQPEGQGLLHVVRGLERQFERLPQLTHEVLDLAEKKVVALTGRVLPGADETSMPAPDKSLEPGN